MWGREGGGGMGQGAAAKLLEKLVGDERERICLYIYMYRRRGRARYIRREKEGDRDRVCVCLCHWPPCQTATQTGVTERQARGIRPQ